jgi:NodT family efflux transporter outer membrane factor (OMF) lipoprotein
LRRRESAYRLFRGPREWAALELALPGQESMMRTKQLRPAWILTALVLISAAGCTSVRQYFRNGCEVGPNYCRPAAPVADTWIDANDKRVQTDHNNLHNWWTVFHDPTLDALIQNASSQNLTVRQAGFRVLQARAARAIAVGNLFPQQQDAFGSYTRNARSVATANSNFGGSERFFDQWDTGFNLSWELDFWGRYRRAVEAADADLNVSIENYDEVLITFLGDVASTYITIRTIQERIVLTEQNIKLQQETLAVVDARFRGGQVSEFDYDQALSTLAQTEALLPAFDLQLRQAMDQLCVLLAITPRDLNAIIGHGPIPVCPPEVAIGIPADLLRQRPDVRAAERQVAAQSARVGVATSELYPHIAITGTVGYSAEEFSNLFTSQAFMGNVGPSFQWNVLNYGRLLNNIRLQDAHLAELIVAYQQSVLQANSEVEDGVARFLYSQEQAKALAVSVDAANKAFIIGASQYRGGTIDFTRLVLVEQNLVQQQDQYAQSQGEIAQGLVDTYRALGGGWQIRLERLPIVESIPLPPAEPNPAGPSIMESMPVPSDMTPPNDATLTPPPVPPQPVPAKP